MKKLQATQSGAFVAPQAAPVAAWVEDEKRPDTMKSVRAQLAQNFFAGIGAAIVLAALWIALYQLLKWPPDPGQIALWSGILGAIVFGILMVMRNALDEFYDAWDIKMMLSDLADKDEAYLALQESTGEEIANLEDRVAVLTQENRELRAELIVRHTSRLSRPDAFVHANGETERAIADARTIVERYFRGMPWSRDIMTQLGWTKTQWTNARNAGVAAKAISYAGKNPVIVPASYELACSLLESYRLNEAKASSASADDGPTYLVNDDADDESGQGGEAK